MRKCPEFYFATIKTLSAGAQVKPGSCVAVIAFAVNVKWID